MNEGERQVKQLVEEICKKAAIEEDELRTGGGIGKVSENRADIPYPLNCDLSIPGADVAKHGGLCTSVISKALEERRGTKRLSIRSLMPTLAAMALFLTSTIGCDTVYRSRIDVTCCAMPDSEVAVVVTKDSPESRAVRCLLLDRGYAIRDQVANNPFVNQEMHGEVFSILWAADKPYNPTVIFGQSGRRLTVRLFRLSGPTRPSSIRELTKDLHAVLVTLCSAEGVHVIEY